MEDQKSQAAVGRLLYSSRLKERGELVPLHHSLPPKIVLPSLPPALLGGGPPVVDVAWRLVAAVDAADAVGASAREAAAADRVGCAGNVAVVMVVVGENAKVVVLYPLYPLLSRSCRCCCTRCCHCLCVPLLVAPPPLVLSLLFRYHWWGKEDSYPKQLCMEPKVRVAIPVQGGRRGAREGGKEGSKEEAPACFSIPWVGDKRLVLS